MVLRAELVPVSIPALQADPLSFDTDQSDQSGTSKILITGGTGGIGSALVDWLLDTLGVAAERIVVLSRRGGTHARGCQMIAVDVSDRAALCDCAALQAIKAVHGIFHLAGVLDDGLLSNMTYERIQKVVAPKRGALYLLDLVESRGWTPAWMVAYSSSSSLFGYPGQANYCAGNALFDNITHWGVDGSSASDFPFIAINWGPWGEAGMAAKGTKAYDLSVENGEYPMGTKESLDALHAALVATQSHPCLTTQYAVCRCDWERTHWHGMPLVAEVEGQVAAAARTVAASSTDKKTAPTKKKGGKKAKSSNSSGGGAVQDFLTKSVGGWTPDESLAAIGLDSLDTVSLRNNFVKEFGKTVKLSLFANPSQTLGDLAKKLEKELASA